MSYALIKRIKTAMHIFLMKTIRFSVHARLKKKAEKGIIMSKYFGDQSYQIPVSLEEIYRAVCNVFKMLMKIWTFRRLQISNVFHYYKL